MKRSSVARAGQTIVERLELRRLLADVTVNGDQQFAGQGDAFVIDRSGTTGRVFLNGAATPAATWVVGSATTVYLNGLTGSDSVRVDHAAGNPFGTGGLVFDGGGGLDAMTFLDASVAEAVSLIAGKVRVDSTDLGYANTESVQIELGRGTDSIFATGDTSFTGGLPIVKVLSGGVLRPASGTVLPSTLDLDLAGSAFLDLSGFNLSVDALTGTGTVRNNGAAATLTIGNGGSNFTFNGTLTNGSGMLGITKRGAGRAELTQASTYTGTTTVFDGALRLANAAALGSTAGFTQIQNGRIELTNGITLNENVELWARAPDAQNLFTPGIVNVSGNNVLAGTLSLTFGGLGYLMQVDAGQLRVVGNVTRVDTSAYHRPLIVRGAGEGRIESPLRSNTSWNFDLRKLDSGTWTIANQAGARDTRVEGGQLRVNTLGNGTLTIDGGELAVIAQPQAIDPDGTSLVPGFTIGGTSELPLGKLDLGNNAFILNYTGTDPTDTLRALLRAGFADGAWTGNGIRSSLAAANGDMALGFARSSDLFTTFPATFGGKTVDNTAVIVTYTLAGDANLDGTVNFDDLLILAQFYDQAEGNWNRGDFNYDGVVNFDDLLRVAQNYGKSIDVAQVWQTIPAASFANTPSSMFTDDELRFVLPLYHFHRIANAVTENGTNRGFIDISVWRDPADNEPYNARVLENQVWFAFFYSQDRPWNPYYNSQQVRYRLEAILDFWVASQSPTGLFAEYGVGQFNLAATSFGLRAAVNTLEILSDGPPIDAAVHQRTVAATLKGLRAMLQDNTLLNQGNDYSNQYSAVYGTALTFARLFPEYEAELLGYLRQRIPQAQASHQSPAGFFYEAGGADWAYTLGTHQTNLTNGWHELKGSEFEAAFIAETTEYYDFVGYNLLRETDGSGYLSNFGATSRLLGKFFTTNTNPLSEFVPGARFMNRTAAEEAAALASQRSSLQGQWGSWPALAVPSNNSYSPSGIIDRDRVGWRPTSAQRTTSTNSLPYLASGNFNHQAVDSRRPIQFTYVRRPTYYSTLNTGQVITSLQRYGLGNLWNQSMGNVLQSQAGSDSQAWGTRAVGAARVYEASTINASFVVAGQNRTPTAGSTRLANGNLTASYSIGNGAGSKSIAYDDTGITVTVNHAASFIEELPILRRSSETIVITSGRATLTRNGIVMTIEFPAGVSASVVNSSNSAGNSMTVSVLKLSTAGSLTYRISFGAPALVQAQPAAITKRRTESFGSSILADAV